MHGCGRRPAASGQKCIPLSNSFHDLQINDQVNDSGDNTDDDNEYNNVNNDRDSIIMLVKVIY